jgi:hypothetical protein
MKITLKNRDLCIDAQDMMETILREHPDLVESVSTDDRVIDFVAQQIMRKWTESGYHGATGEAHSVQYGGLDKAWRDVAKASGDVAKREIERLEGALARADERYLKLLDETAPYRRHA